MIGRCVLAARDSQVNLAPLCFFRHGVEDVASRRYVEAFYDFYFVLETLFANGKINPTQVLKEWLRSSDLCEVVEEVLSNPDDIAELRYVDAVKAGDVVEEQNKEKVLWFLIQTRGMLHHHSQKQSQRRFKWDPANQEAFRFAVTLAKLISARICWRMVKGELFAESVDLRKLFVYASSEEKFQNPLCIF